MENENIFDKINQNFFDSQGKSTIPTKSNNKEQSTDDSLDLLKLVRHIPQSETKNASPIIKKIEIAFPEIDEQKKLEEEEYSDYGRRNKTGIHFQIIDDNNVSIEIVPEDILNDEMQSLLDKYKAVFDSSMKLWLLPFFSFLFLAQLKLDFLYIFELWSLFCIFYN